MRSFKGSAVPDFPETQDLGFEVVVVPSVTVAAFGGEIENNRRPSGMPQEAICCCHPYTESDEERNVTVRSEDEKDEDNNVIVITILLVAMVVTVLLVVLFKRTRKATLLTPVPEVQTPAAETEQELKAARKAAMPGMTPHSGAGEHERDDAGSHDFKVGDTVDTKKIIPLAGDIPIGVHGCVVGVTDDELDVRFTGSDKKYGYLNGGFAGGVLTYSKSFFEPCTEERHRDYEATFVSSAHKTRRLMQNLAFYEARGF